MGITVPVGSIYLAMNVVCAITNIMIAPQTFGLGFAVGVIVGLGENIYLRHQIPTNADAHFSSKKIEKLDPRPGPLGTFVAYVAMKVNEYAIPYLPFYTISLFAGVPLGYSTGKMLGLLPWKNQFKAAFA